MYFSCFILGFSHFGQNLFGWLFWRRDKGRRESFDYQFNFVNFSWFNYPHSSYVLLTFYIFVGYYSFHLEFKIFSHVTKLFIYYFKKTSPVFVVITLLVLHFLSVILSFVLILVFFSLRSIVRHVSVFFFFNLFFYWRIIALQNFVVFCQISAWISHRYTHIPSCLNLPPTPTPLHLSGLIQSPCLSFLSHTANSHWLSILHVVM